MVEAERVPEFRWAQILLSAHHAFRGWYLAAQMKRIERKRGSHEIRAFRFFSHRWGVSKSLYASNYAR